MGSRRSPHSAPNRIIRIASLSCTHAPFTDERAFKAALRIIREWDPSVLIHQGDLLEAGSASVHPSEYQHDQRDEYEAAAALLSKLEAVSPNAHERVWIRGNHDQNLMDPDPRRIPKSLRRAVHWSNQSDDVSSVFRRWRPIPYINSSEGAYCVGPIIFTHGFRTGANSDFLEALEFHYATGSVPNRLVVRGHTHRPVPPTQVIFHSVPFHLHVMNVGHLGPRKPHYMGRRSSLLWGHSLGLFTVRGSRWTAKLVPLP